MSRFTKFTGIPPALPACSFFSRTNDDEYFLDTGMQIEEGAVYLGSRDAEEIATVIGWVSPERLERLTRAYKKMEEEHRAMVAAIDRLDSLPDLLRATVKGIREARKAATTAPTIQLGPNNEVEFRPYVAGDGPVEQDSVDQSS